ncbi:MULTISPECIES: hypothetical protein [unclassified Pseudoxanthomonas]|uniref:hypothetical protein n=1 Tax=unclassified Pseudoxanthomonas TaxID=2645906 RepID=UPI0030776DA6
MLVRIALHLILACLLALVALPAAAREAPATTRVVVLGVNHAAQLVSESDQPAALAAFVTRLAPQAICVERAPEQFARNDHYEFTYEIQDVVVPLARARGISLCPFDWMPPAEDEVLGFGMSISTLPEVRPPRAFLAFPEPAALQRGLFHADDRKNLAKVDDWIRNIPTQAARDLPRRLYLYRTFLQSQRIAAAAKAHVGGTVLVVVGEFHKYDIEAILAGTPGIEVVQPSQIGLPSAEQVAAHHQRDYYLAIARFNLLGAQAATGNVDWDWIGRVLDALTRESDNAEVALLRTRYARLRGTMSRENAIVAYQEIANRADASQPAGWDGVLDRQRVDSYFDPFGNLRIDQRARVELARELGSGQADAVETIRATLTKELTPRQARQFDAYWSRDIVKGE